MAELDDLGGPFQPNCFCDSLLLKLMKIFQNIQPNQLISIIVKEPKNILSFKFSTDLHPIELKMFILWMIQIINKTKDWEKITEASCIE